MELSNGVMSGIRFSFNKKSTFGGHLPKVLASLAAAHEFLNGEVLRVISTPDSSRAAKIWYTGLLAYASPGEYDGLLRLYDKPS
jgi:hypothetical protein